MSVESLAIVLHHSAARGTEKLVLIGIANHDGDGGAWPSIATLARYANVSDRSVRRAIVALVEAGELEVIPQAGGLMDTPDVLRPNLYRIKIACPATCDRTTQHKPRQDPLTHTSGGGGHTRHPPPDTHVTRTVLRTAHKPGGGTRS